MSENYSKADLRHIAESLIEDLRECEDGTDITSWQLVKAVGYDMDEFKLLTKKIKTINKITSKGFDLDFLGESHEK